MAYKLIRAETDDPIIVAFCDSLEKGHISQVVRRLFTALIKAISIGDMSVGRVIDGKFRIVSDAEGYENASGGIKGLH